MKKGYKNLILVGTMSALVLAGCAGGAGSGGGSVKPAETEAVVETVEASGNETGESTANGSATEETSESEGQPETDDQKDNTGESQRGDVSVGEKEYFKGDKVSSSDELPSSYIDVAAANDILNGIFEGEYDDEIVWDEHNSGRGVLAAAYSMSMHVTNRMLYYTENGGKSWKISKTECGYKYDGSAIVNGSKVVIIPALKNGCAAPVYVSFDGGKTLMTTSAEKIMFEDITEALVELPNNYARIVSLSNDGELVVDWYMEKGDSKDVLLMEKTYEMIEDTKNPLKKSEVIRETESELGIFYLYCRVNAMSNNSTDDIGLFPNSSKEYLTTDDVEKVLASINTNYATERMAVQAGINEIYARKGYDFTGTGYDDYCSFVAFNRKNVSTENFGKLPLSSVKDSDFTEIEKRNIDLLAAYRNKKY